MDPVIPIIVILSLLAGGGASGVAVAAYREYRRQAMRRVLREERTHGSHSLSIFDVFWDLGANDIALEMMRHNGLLPASSDEGGGAHRELDSLIEAYGGYGPFVEETLEVIDEFDEAQRESGRRSIPVLKSRGRKLLPVDDVTEEGAAIQPGALQRTEGGADSDEGRAERLGHFADASLKRRAGLREMERPSGLRVHHRDGSSRELVDVDDFAEMSTGDVIGNLLEGRFTETLQQWWDRRHLRALKSDLDEAFEELYDFYVDEVERRSNFYDDLFEESDRWSREAERIERLRERSPLSGESTGLAAELLLEMAAETARDIARRAEGNTRKTIERIHAFARRDDFAMAGYLVYLNRNAFFAGRSPGYGEYVRRIENLAHRLRSEVRKAQGA